MNAYVPVGQRRYSPALRKATDVAPSVNPTPDVIPASSNHLWAPTVMLRRKAAATRRGRAVSQSRRHVWRDLWIVRGMTCSFSPPWVLCQPVQAGAHHLHGDALMIAVGGVEDVAGNQLDGLDHAHSTDRRPYGRAAVKWHHVSCSPALGRRQVSQLREQEVAHRDVATCDVTPNALWRNSSQVPPGIKFLRT